MEIDKTNYEIWFIDWLDGNLSKAQIEELMQFLNENPGLRDEFNDLNQVNLKPSAHLFKNKEQLKKSPSDIPKYQFEYLCAAYLEKDLSASQQSELKEMTEADADKKRTFELIQKMRLAPPGLTYKHKSRLLKRTAGQKINRLSVIGLSAAAMLALIIMTYLILPHNPSDPLSKTALNIAIDSTILKPSPANVPNSVSALRNPLPEVQKKEKRVDRVQTAAVIPDNSLARKKDNTEIMPAKISVNSRIYFDKVINSNSLVASDLKFTAPSVEEEGNRIGRFLAKTFREKILKENTTLDTPLRGYEIAEAGITGLNKLLGWQMALKENNDENGEVRSVYFSSKILKFNAPVKKNAAMQ